MQAYKHIIFDLDGTLVDSSGDIIACLSEAYALEGMKDVTITPFHVGPKLDRLITTLTPDIKPQQREKVVKNYRNLYDNQTERQCSLYPGVAEGLEQLRARQCTLYVATNKPRSATIPLLYSLNIGMMFTSIITPSSIHGIELDKTQMIASLLSIHCNAKEQTLMVGDHPDDIQAAKNNGVASAAVLYGYTDKSLMLGTGADHNINFFSEIAHL